MTPTADRLSHPPANLVDADRRRFLARSGSLVLAAAFPLSHVERAAAQTPAAPPRGADTGWISVDDHGKIALTFPKSEMGQGTWTAWCMIVADELDVSPANIRMQDPPVDAERFRDPELRKQATFGSSGVSAWFNSLSIAAARLRLGLIQAAARQWQVAPSACTTHLGQVVHPASGRRLNYGGLVQAALREPLPQAEPMVPALARHVGRKLARVDSPDKVAGRARYGIDHLMKNQVTALLVTPPRTGAQLDSFDDSAARAIKGYRGTLKVSAGLVVMGEGFHAAQKAKAALKAMWVDPAQPVADSSALQQALRGALDRDGVIVRKDGDPAAQIAKAPIRHSAVYDAPMLAHLPMEPLNCSAHFHDGQLELWVGTQDQEETLKAAVEVSGLAPANIRIHTPLLGGGFGRRAATDFVRPAIEAALRSPHPVKLIIERADELRMGHFRPAAAARFEAGVDGEGRITGFLARMACPSISKPFFGANQKGAFGEHDFFASQGIASPVYHLPHRETRWLDMPSAFTPWIWRGVGMSQNLFFLECFIDELAALAKLDPLEFRRRNVQAPRARAMLDELDVFTAWRRDLPPGHAWGMGLQLYNNAGFALMAEVSLKDGAPRVHRVTCVVDCGRIVNPDQVRAQTEGGIMMGLAAALHGGILVKDGAVAQSNFHDARVLRMNEAPTVDVRLLEGVRTIHGMGEYSTALICPAVANALVRLGRPRSHSLPLIEA